jgi:hypothetical protein
MSVIAATGSGYASSVYAVYSAYASTHPSGSSLPPMEYLSLPHTRAASHKLVPEVNDELLTNLRNPIITLVEDTTPGAHDTLTAACDANLYTALGVDQPAEHGSCAENLVLALKELNEGAGLKGTKAVGADITVNIAPTPLHLFMNAPLDVSSVDKTDGAGAKGAILKVDEPKGKKRSFVRFRAAHAPWTSANRMAGDVWQRTSWLKMYKRVKILRVPCHLSRRRNPHLRS